MRKIKILFTIPNFDTAGSGKVVYDLVKGLDKTKFNPEICCFHNRGAFFKEVEKLGVKIHIFPFTTSYKPYWSFLFRAYKISKFFRLHKFDIIHSWHWSSDFSEPLAAKLAGIPFVYTKKAMSWGNKAWMWRSKLSTKIIYINSDMGNEFFSTMKKKAVEIPLGVDTVYFNPNDKSIKCPSEITVSKDDFKIVSIANLVPVKGIEVLLKAVKKLDNPSIKVFIVGANDNEYGQNLIKKYQDFHFVGKKTDIRPYLKMANLFVIPTKDEGRKEGMPIAPLEAMAMGKIVIGSRISGITDVLKEFPEHRFEAGNIKELQRLITHFKNKEQSEIETLQAKSRAYVVEHLSINNFITNHQQFYTQLAK